MSKNHANISIFIPHNGCPHQCSFCNQKTITGQTSQPDGNDVKSILDNAKKYTNPNTKTQIAFFGGSFTAVKREYMIELLKAAYPYVKDKTFDSIRISTRPDAINHEILSILKEYGVKDIELGCQSMDNDVLFSNKRGHTQDDIISASELIKSYGFSLGLQMMVGLYKSTPQKDIDTACKIIALKPSSVRIYPTVVMKNTLLCDLFYEGKYIPYDFDLTVSLCS
ncbi:MAG: radical SAM protein, partial [Clostridia bacterium]|nr:radical SAM protein [Clostridia bacterium]